MANALFWKLFVAIAFVITLQILVIYYRVHHDVESHLPDEIFFGATGGKIIKQPPLTPIAPPTPIHHGHNPIQSHESKSHENGSGDLLPAISYDNSEVILNSILERSFSSSNLHITTIFASAAMFDPNEVRQYKVERIEHSKLQQWKSLLKNQKSILYLKTGRRSPIVKYTCRYSIEGENLQTVEGHFLPNRQSSDSNSNRRYDILRCPISHSKQLYDRYRSGISRNLSVAIFREGTMLIHFSIPWETRQTGYLSSLPHFASKFDPWSNYGSHHTQTSSNHFHVCAARSPNRMTHYDLIYRYLEFLQHHLLIGTTHVFLSVPYSWDSPSMKQLAHVLHPYIQKKEVSIISESGENINMWTSTLGLQWNQLAVRNLQIHNCLYLSKGVAKYIGVWDTNEFFIPRPPHHTIQDVINSVSITPFSNHTLIPNDFLSIKVADWKGGVGLADGDGHPYCHLAVSGYVVSVPGRNFATKNHWIEGLYKSSIVKEEALAKSILPTEIIHQAGLHISGGCKLERQWTTCNSTTSSKIKHDKFCYNHVPDFMYISDQIETKSKVHSIPSYHNMDDIVQTRDLKSINPHTDGCIISFQGASSMQNSQARTSNSYLDHYSRNVLQHLRNNGIEFALEQIPEETILNFTNPDGKSLWFRYEEVFPPRPQSTTTQVTRTSIEEPPLAYDPDNIFHGSSNGFYHFTEDFAQGDLLLHNQNQNHQHQFQQHQHTILPSFASDYSDIALSAIIERQHNSWNLFVTTFFLQHEMLWKPPIDYGFKKIHPAAQRNWEIASANFNNSKYLPSGERDTSVSRYRCRLTISLNSESYITPGKFLPNALSPDRNANRRLDILRCQIKDSMKLYRLMPNSNESLHVEILRDKISLFNYSIPWKTRRVGYSLSSPPIADTFNAWEGSEQKEVDGRVVDGSAVKRVNLPGSLLNNRLHMCVAGIESPLSQHSTTQYLEFIQHHLLMGIDHMFISTAYAWNGKNMANFLVILRSYLNERRLTITSMASDNIDLLYSILGATIDRDNSKVFNVNMCLYLSKGVADYVVVWDTDEFFIPRPPYNTILDLIRGIESSEELLPENITYDTPWLGGRGWADGARHPFCYIQLTSEVILRSENASLHSSGHWIGNAYFSPPSKSVGLGFKKSIFPTRKIFQAGLHVGGACHLGKVWSGCNHSEFCYIDDQKNNKLGVQPHRFDDIVLDKNAKRIDPKKEAVIYHIQLHRPELTHSLPESSTNQHEKNDYVIHHFDRVYKELSRRGLHVIESLVDHETNAQTEADTSWLKLYEMTRKYVDSPLLPDGSNDLEKLPEPSESFFGVPNLLPHFVRDCTDIILGAVIERAHDSWNLHVTTFFMANEQLANYTGKIINPSLKKEGLKAWMKAIQHSRKIRNTEYGVRNDGYQYYCDIINHQGGRKYRVPGYFVANELTPDVNANKRLDILRCKISDSKSAYHLLAGTNESLFVEIFRGNSSLVRYQLPWKTRRVGYMLSAPTSSTRLDPWKGYHPINKSNPTNVSTEILPGQVGGDMIHMCVPGFESPISKTTLAMYTEFLQHHFTIGVEHIHVGATYTWDGQTMDEFKGAIQSYIDDGMISLTSTASDLDYVYGLFGMAMHRDNVKIFYVNMCLYYTKGLAEYIAIWDIDEYFIPKLPHSTISQVIAAMDISPRDTLQPYSSETTNLFDLAKNWSGGKGWADSEAHPLCYFMMSSEVLYRPPLSYPISTLSNRWIGSRFLFAPETEKTHLKFKKPIIPTRKIFQGALHMVGGCKLNYPFHGCDENTEFCYAKSAKDRYGWTELTNSAGIPTKRIDFSTTQRFDGLIMDKDAKKVNANTEAVIYHIQIHRTYFTSTAPSNSTNEYVTRFFSSVLENLKLRGLEYLTTTPEFYQTPDRELDHSWISFREMYHNVTQQQQQQQQRKKV